MALVWCRISLNLTTIKSVQNATKLTSALDCVQRRSCTTAVGILLLQLGIPLPGRESSKCLVL